MRWWGVVVVVSAVGSFEVGCLEVGLVGHGLQLLGGLLFLLRLALTARGLVVALAGLCWWRRWVGQVRDCWWRRWWCGRMVAAVAVPVWASLMMAGPACVFRTVVAAGCCPGLWYRAGRRPASV